MWGGGGSGGEWDRNWGIENVSANVLFMGLMSGGGIWMQ